MGFRAKITAAIVGFLSGAPDLGTARHEFDDTTEILLSLGTAADQANAIYADDFTIASGATLVLDLAGGVTNALGVTYTFTAVKALKIEADDGNTLNIVYGGGSNPFLGWFADPTDKGVVAPGGVALHVDPTAGGRAVTAATGDLLLLALSGTGSSVSGRITIVGEA